MQIIIIIRNKMVITKDDKSSRLVASTDLNESIEGKGSSNEVDAFLTSDAADKLSVPK